MFAGAPGIFNKIALIAPPAMVEVYTPPSMINPCSAGMWKVNGISKATAIVGLNPGAAPSKIPPMVAKIKVIRLIKENTSPK